MKRVRPRYSRINAEVDHMLAEGKRAPATTASRAVSLSRLTRPARPAAACSRAAARRLGQKKTLTPSDIKDEQLIGLSRHLPLGVQVERMFADTNVPLRFAVEVTQSTMALSLVRAGAGVALLDGFSCLTAWGPDLTARPLAPPTKSLARILTARDRPPARLAVEFCDTLHDVAGEMDFELPRAKRR